MVVGTACPASVLSGLTYVKGEPVKLGDGHAVVLEFWATWCPPCRQTIPHLTKISNAFKANGVRFVGITSETEVPKVKAFVDKMGDTMDYAVALDTAGSAQELMNTAGAHGIPHAFVVGGDGRITWSGHPADPAFEKAVRDAAQGGAAPAPAAAMRELPLITDSYEALMTKTAKELKTILAERGIDTKDCLEKGDFARKIVETCASVRYFAKQ